MALKTNGTLCAEPVYIRYTLSVQTAFYSKRTLQRHRKHIEMSNSRGRTAGLASVGLTPTVQACRMVPNALFGDDMYTARHENCVREVQPLVSSTTLAFCCHLPNCCFCCITHNFYNSFCCTSKFIVHTLEESADTGKSFSGIDRILSISLLPPWLCFSSSESLKFGD